MDQETRQFFRDMGRNGGAKAAQQMTHQERSERARMANYARYHPLQWAAMKNKAQLTQTTIWQSIKAKLKENS